MKKMRDKRKTQKEPSEKLKELRRKIHTSKPEDPLESEELFRTVIEASKDAMIVINQKGIITIFNPAAEEIFKRKKEEMKGQPLDLLMPEQYRDLHKKYVKEFFTRGSPSGAIGKTLELPALRSDGTVFFIELSLSTALIKNEKFVLSVIRDIEERKKSEEELRKSREFLNNIINAIDDPIFVKDENHKWVLLNDAACRLMGYSREELLGKRDYEIFPKEQADVFREKDMAVIEPGEININEEEITWQKRIRTISTKKSVFTDSVTGKKFIAGTIRDITDRKKAEEERHRLATAIEHAAESVIITDKEATIQYVNPAYKKITGYRRNEIIGKKFNILQKGKHNESFYEDMWETIKNGFVWSGHFINTKKDGTPYEVEISISPIRDSNKNIISYVAVKRDITKEMKLQKEMRQSQKMEALGTLAGGIAHDFNNMITAIMGYTEVMHNYKVNRIEVDAYLEKILKVCKRARDMIKNILDFSRPGKRIYRVVDIRNIIKEVIPLVRSSLPENVEIKRNIPEGPFNVLADSSQIYQVIMNLCINAAHSMREKGGILQIDLKKVIPDEDLGLSEECKTKTYIKLTVSDTGHGMERDVIERIFEPYFTTKKQGEGTGLGLALAHRFIKEHNGKVTVESIPGKGSIFNVYLPLADSDIKPGQEEIPGVYERAEAPLSEEKSFKGKGRILCVDDEEDLLYVCKFGLERIGYEVVTKNNSLNAFNLFREDPRRFDLVLTDYSMPGMTGSMLAKEIMNLRPDIPIIIYSAYIEEINREKKKITGVKKFLTKPFTIKQLLEIIRETLSEA